MQGLLRKVIGPKKAPEHVELKGLRHAWLSPRGELHPVHEHGHCAYAENKLGHYDYKLEALGWRRLSEGNWYGRDFSQSQLDVIFDWHQSNEHSFEPHRFELRDA